MPPPMPPPQMTAQQALDLVTQVVTIFKGTWEDHLALRGAIGTLNDLVVTAGATIPDAPESEPEEPESD